MRQPPPRDAELEAAPVRDLDLAPALSGRTAAMGTAAGRTLLPERLRLPVCFLGVFACYFYYGILQETM